jgi:hypothetical protein
MACAPVVGTSLLRHKNALRPNLHRLTNHGYLLPSRFFKLPKNVKKIEFPYRAVGYFSKEPDFLQKVSLSELDVPLCEKINL